MSHLDEFDEEQPISGTNGLPLAFSPFLAHYCVFQLGTKAPTSGTNGPIHGIFKR